MTKKILQQFQFLEGQKILKQSTAEKKSDWLGIWRKRKIVLTQIRLAFYENEQCNDQPTIQLFLGQIVTIKICEDNGSKLTISSVRGQYQIKFQTFQVAQSWKQQISQAIRSYKVKKSQLFASGKLNQRLDQQQKSCGIFCF